MRSTKWIVEVNDQRYAIDRTFDGSPSIYYLEVPNVHPRVHIDNLPPNDSDQIIILAHLVLDNPAPLARGTVTVLDAKEGEVELDIPIPDDLKPGEYELTWTLTERN